MKLRKRSIVSVVFVLLFFQPASTPGGARVVLRGRRDFLKKRHFRAAPCYPEVDFRWAFAAKTLQDGKSSTQPVTQDMALKSGDQVKMMVELQRKCFVYLFHDNRRDSVKLLFPYALQQFEGDYQPERRYYIPRGDAWFRLDDNPGQEVFYLVASAKRLDDLEKAYMRHESAEAALKVETARALVDLIKELRREHRELSSPAERPVPIGGDLEKRWKSPGPRPVGHRNFCRRDSLDRLRGQDLYD